MPESRPDVRNAEIKPTFQPIKSWPVALPVIDFYPLDTLRTLGTKAGGRVYTVSPHDQRIDQVLALT